MRQSVLFVIALTGVLGCATTRGTGVPPDATALEHVLDEWAIAWSSSQVERLLPLANVDPTRAPLTALSRSSRLPRTGSAAPGQLDAGRSRVH